MASHQRTPVVPPEICHAVFPAGLALAASRAFFLVRCNNYIGESCNDLLGATARNSACRTSTCSQNFARVLPNFFQFCRRQKGDQKWRPKLGSVKLNSSFTGTVLGSTFGPCFQFPQLSQKCANCWTRPEILEAGTQPSSQPRPAATSHHAGPFPQDLKCSCQ